ncbi:MAG: PIN domain-containing protein [Nitrososphaera sp.]|nr:PIN domain-containing protein [Nitrososphaera sp.]
MLTILRLAESGRLELLSSDALEFEIDRIPNRYRKARAIEMLKLADYVIELNNEIETQADILVKLGLKPMDALHLASASWSKADYFCTCDDKFLKKTKDMKDLGVEVVSPLQLIEEVAP